jgi:hypothetical protein
MESLPGFRVPPAREEAMTAAIEQEATAIFAAELAAFLEDAIAKLDALAPRPSAEREGHPEPEKAPEPEKPAKKPRMRKAAAPPVENAPIADAPRVEEPEPQPDPVQLPVEAVGGPADLSHLVDAVGDPVDGSAVLGGQAADPPPGDLPLQLDHREQAA